MEAVPPASYVGLTEELQSSEASLKRMGEIVSRNFGMKGKILQLVNSGVLVLLEMITADSILPLLLEASGYESWALYYCQ